MLLDPELIPVRDAVERLVGLQAQVPNSPYIGLWTRLRDFRRDGLTRLLEQWEVVRAMLMRATLHLLTAKGYLLLRPVLQPALTHSLRSISGRRLEGLDLDRLVATAQTSVKEAPRTFAELRGLLSGLKPDRDPSQPWPTWCARTSRSSRCRREAPGALGSPTHALAESWLGGRLAAPNESLRALLVRYLTTIGPASVKDIQTWSGLVRLTEPIEELKSELRIFGDENGDERLDLPRAPLTLADAPAPSRFVPK